jgi:hypothetical protein
MDRFGEPGREPPSARNDPAPEFDTLSFVMRQRSRQPIAARSNRIGQSLRI